MNQIAIAIATYNGGERIIRQLESIISQTMLPDEIVICDDGSTDNTVKLIESYSEHHKEISWNIISNERNLGYKRNFQKAILATESNIIFLSDQDDYWKRDKIEKMYSTMFSHPEIMVLASKYCKIDEDTFSKNEKAIGRIENESIEPYSDEKLKQIGFSEFFYMTHFPGCSIAIKKECKNWFSSNFWDGNEPHDEYLLIMAQLYDSAFYIDEELMYYIRHDNAVTFNKMRNREERISHLSGKKQALQVAMNVIRNNPNIVEASEKNRLVERQYNFINKRIAFTKKPSIRCALNLIFNISKYERISYLLGDIYLSLRK